MTQILMTVPSQLTPHLHIPVQEITMDASSAWQV